MMNSLFGLVFVVLPMVCCANVQVCTPTSGCVNGVCVNSNMNTICVCEPGWRGTLCDEAFDPCDPNPCRNEGECIDLGNSFLCECEDRFTGDFCNEAMNSCVSDPCKNGGTCTDVDGSGKFKCDCKLGYFGSTCKKSIYRLLLIQHLLESRRTCTPNVCETSPCPSHTGARCQRSSNGCSARFYDKFNNDITRTCDCPRDAAIAPCNLGQTCLGSTCHGYAPETVECRINRCGTCRPEYFNQLQRRVICSGVPPAAQQTPAVPQLPPSSGGGQYDSRCPAPWLLPNPCPGTSCSSNDDCRSDYMCCRASCPGQSSCVQKSATGACDPGQYVYTCGNSCAGRTCPGYPTAQCRVESCNGCKAEFFDQNNQVIKSCVFFG